MPIKNLNKEDFFSIFSKCPHVFLSRNHLEAHLNETETCVYLSNEDLSVGVFLKKVNSQVFCPYSAPFGGVFSKDSRVQFNIIDLFVRELCVYLIKIGVQSLRIVFPSALYSTNTSTKVINSFINLDYSIKIIPDINNHIELSAYRELSYHKNTKKLIRRATEAGLTMNEVFDEQKFTIYNILKENRESKSRFLSLSYNKLRSLDQICGTRYYIVKDNNGAPIAGGIIFQLTPRIMYAQYWGDNEIGRKLNAMDFLSTNLVKLFMKEGFSYFDVGVSSENGIPNNGLLRFKESHLFDSTLRLTIDLKLI